jgi:hypothetical protein
MEAVHYIAGCVYDIKPEKLQQVLDTDCFNLLDTYFYLPWWKRLFKKKPLSYKVLCTKATNIFYN